MSEATNGRGGRPAWLWIAAVLAATSLVFYAWVGLHKAGVKVEWWGQLGSGMALFSALFNAGALIAALYTLHLQRQELERARRDALGIKVRAERGLIAQENLIVAQNLGAAIAAHSALAKAYGDQLDRLDPDPDEDEERKRLTDLLNTHASKVEKLTRASLRMAKTVLSFHKIMRTKDPALTALGLADDAKQQMKGGTNA